MMLTNRQLFLLYNAQTSDAPLLIEVESADGNYIIDIDEKKYLDFISGISVSSIGHRHPCVIDAIKNQLEKHMHVMVYGEFVQSSQTKLAKKFHDYLFPFYNKTIATYFVNSGSEATEGALKLAKRFTQKNEIIYFEGAYHGSSHGALSVMGNEYYKSAFHPLLPNTKMLKYNEISELENITNETACVIIEPVQSETGYVVAEKIFLQKLRERCNETNTLLIFDEVQSGFGRTGKMFAFENYNVVPDIITIAKGMGGGLPIGAFLAQKSIMDSLMQNPVLGHITTFGGNVVCCAAANAVFDFLQKEKIYSDAEVKENLIREKLKHDSIKSISGKGLMLAIEFESFELNKKIIDECIVKGLLVDWFLYAPNKLRISPPLTITNDEIIFACDTILDAIKLFAAKN